jgi:hypothetical protein
MQKEFQTELLSRKNELIEKIADAMSVNDFETVENLQNSYNFIDSQIVKINEDIEGLSTLEGALAQVIFQNEVTDDDIKRFVEVNTYLFQNLGYMPRIQKANIQDSIYSFNFINEAIEKNQPLILSTTIPGLEALNQVGASQTRVAHVMSAGPISGQIQLSLNAVCGNGEDEPDDASIGSILVVNRVYNIPTISEYGYKATLDVKRITSAIGERISSSTNHGYTLRQINNIVYSNQFKDDFHIEFYEGHEPDSPLQIQEISDNALDRLVNRYITELEDSNLIEVTGYEEHIPAQGGMVMVQQTGRTCKRKWYGSKRCWDTVYNVQKWVDGYSELQVNEYSSVQLHFTESMNVEDIVKKPMGSTFSSIKIQ